MRLLALKTAARQVPFRARDDLGTGCGGPEVQPVAGGPEQSTSDLKPHSELVPDRAPAHGTVGAWPQSRHRMVGPNEHQAPPLLRSGSPETSNPKIQALAGTGDN